jgi:hypothetical protein
METSINVQTNTFAQRWKISGFADPRNNKVDIQIFNKDGAIKVPYFDERYNLKSSFDSIRLNIENIDKVAANCILMATLRLPTLG